MAEPSGEVLRLLEEQPWDDIVPRLLRHASIKMKRLRWLGEWSGAPPRGMEPCDIVQLTIEKVLSGGRAWDPEQQPGLLRHLMSAVDSEVSNLVNLKENRETKREAQLNASEDHDPLGLDGFSGGAATPEQIILDEEAQRRGDDFVQGFWESLDGEPELQEVVEAHIDGVATPAKIATRLGVRAEEIYKRKKRLCRRLHDFQEGRVRSQEKGARGNA